MKAVLAIFLALPAAASALDREAFTFTSYNLQIRIDPAKQFLAASGSISLRNDSAAPQRIAVLQISSSLDWKSIRVEKKPVQYLTQLYTSDIDHSGGLSEAIVTLPRALPPKETVSLELAYEGIVPQDATRLERIGTPKEIAAANDWDRISESFTALRGVGYVCWYPVAMEAASLSSGNQFSETLGGWKLRHAGSRMAIDFVAPVGQEMYATGTGVVRTAVPATATYTWFYSWSGFGLDVPAFVLGRYRRLEQPGALVHYVDDHEPEASNYAHVAANVGWVSTNPSRRFEIVELPDVKAAPFQDGPVLLTPLKPTPVPELEVTIAFARQHADVNSPRLWIYEGLAAAAQAIQREKQGGRAAAILFMGRQRPALIAAEKANLESAMPNPKPSEAATALVATLDDSSARLKGIYVWWMLRDMLGDRVIQRAFLKYRAEEDKEPSYVQRLLEAEARISTPHAAANLEQFFDDWVYRDRGLPDFRIASVYARQMLGSGFLLTVTVENLGSAGAEVPVIGRAKDESANRRLWVPARQKATVRIPLRSQPTEAQVNDGSVPESDTANNVVTVESSSQQ